MPMRNALAFSAAVLLAPTSAVIFATLAPGAAYALDKVDPYICPTMEKGSGKSSTKRDDRKMAR